MDGGLALTACLLQSPYFLDYEGYQRSEPEGLDVRGFSALSRLYKAADGWLYLHCNDDSDWQRLFGLDKFSCLSDDDRFRSLESRKSNDHALADAISKIIAGDTRHTWVERLTGAGISAIENMDVEDFHTAPHVRKAGLVVCREHPDFGTADHLGVVPTLSGTPARLGRPTPVLGAETDEILTEAGYTSGEIANVKAVGAVVQHSE